MEARIEKRSEGTFFVCGSVTFPVFADDMAKSAYQIDALSDSARQAILLDSHLPVEPWIPESARHVLLGIVQKLWYQHFTGEVPVKVAKKQEDRERDYPKMLKVTQERKDAAAAKAAATLARNQGKPAPTPEEIAAKKKAKDDAKFAKDKAKAEKIAAREAKKNLSAQEKDLNKSLAAAERAAKGSTPRAPRAPRAPKTSTPRKYRLVESQKTIWSAYLGQKQIIVRAMLALKAPSTVVEIAAKCVFENSRQTAVSVVSYYMNNLSSSAGTIEAIEEAAAPVVVETPAVVPAVESQPTETKKSSKKGKKA